MAEPARTLLRARLWESMLDANLNARYWQHLSRKYSRNDKYVKIFLAVMSSGTVGGWLADCEVIYKLLSVSAAITAVILPILNWQEAIQSTSDLRGRWLELQTEYENLWHDLETNNRSVKQLEQELKRLKKKEVDAGKTEKDLPVKESLSKKCYDEVVTSRGLQ